MRRFKRLLAGVGATVVLVAGCGGGDAAPALSKEQVRKSLPDTEMQGWRTLLKPRALVMSGDGDENPCRAGKKGCAGARFYGASEFLTNDKLITVNFQLIAYKDEKAAEAAYNVMWKAYRSAVGKSEGSSPAIDVGDLSSARVGTVGVEDASEDRAVVQMRVGANLGWLHVRGKGVTVRLAEHWAKRLAYRTKRVQNGKTPLPHSPGG